GFFAGAAALGLKAALLAASDPFAAPGTAVFVFAYPLCGRFGAALVPRIAPPVNPGSLGALAKESSARRCAGGMTAALLLWAFTGGGLACLAGAAGLVPGAGGAFAPAGAAAEMAAAAALVPAAAGLAAAVFLLCPLTAFFYARLYAKSLGGYTGDAMGAAVETAEILSLAAILAALRI
ncbi:MAG: adenosylcobinamide-GDP ribazoletransferase, partial [Treponema sp.]|nr:adenosylcobinamide-GDP ribazoletransferase [Treponema sp.]